MEKHQQNKDTPDTTVYFDPPVIKTKAGIFEFVNRVLPPKRIEEDCGYQRPNSVRSDDAEKDYSKSTVVVSEMSSNTDTVSVVTEKASDETNQDGAIRCLGSPDLARRRILFHDGLSAFLKSIKHAKSNSADETQDNLEVSSADAKCVNSPITDGCGELNQAHNYSKTSGDYLDIQTPVKITQYKKSNEFPTKQNDIESTYCKAISSSSSPMSKSKLALQRSGGINSSISVAQQTKNHKVEAAITEQMSSAKENFEMSESMSSGKLQPADLIHIYDAERLSPMTKGILNVSNKVVENCSYSPSNSKLKSKRSWQQQNKYISPTIKPLRADEIQIKSCMKSCQKLKPESQKSVNLGKLDAGEVVKNVNTGTGIKSLEEIGVKSFNSSKPTPNSPSAKHGEKGEPLKSLQIQEDAKENACQTEISTNSDIKKLCEKLVGPAGLELDKTESGSVGHAHVNYFINVENINVTFKN